MEDNNLVNKESVEALMALTDLVRKSDPNENIVKYDIDTMEYLYNVAKNTEGISKESVEQIRNISKEKREENQGKVIDFAACSKDELYFHLSPKVCSELYEILKNIEKDKTLKIPNLYIETIVNNRDINNPVHYDWNKQLINQEFEEGTIKFLNWVCYEFWLENDAEREVWRNRFNSTDLIEIKEDLFTKIKNFFKSK